MIQNEILQVLSGFVGSVGFAVLFHIRGKRLWVASFGGFLSWFLFLLLNRWIGNEVLVYFIVAVILSAYAELMARVLKSPATTFTITSLIPMIPGSSLYSTMVSAFEAGQEEFLEKAIYTLKLASALALGIIVATAFTRILQERLRHRT